MKTLKDFNFKNKRVLIRCDFNLPLNKKGQIEDDFRMGQTIPTIEYLIEKQAKLILMSHLGNPKARVVESLRLTPIQDKLTEHLDFSVTKALDCIGREIEEQIQEMMPGEILLLENLRFHKEEEEGDFSFAKELAKLADIYINDAFGACHRAHASIIGVPKYLPSAAGLLLEKEIKILSKVFENPLRPLVAIIGGKKIESKSRAIERFLEKADYLLVGGKIADVISIKSDKLCLPIDKTTSLDIGPETIKMFSGIIKKAKTILWSGPLGYFEDPKYERGTKEIAQEIVKNKKAFKIAGGGDTVFALSKFGLREKFNHISTGGGAMLAFLGGEELPGLKALNYY